MSQRAIGFVVVGGIAGAVNVAARILFSQAVRYEAAVALAFPVALTVAFLLNRHYVFKATDAAATAQYGKFALVNIAALLQVWLISVGLAKVLFPWFGFVWHAETIAHAIGVVSPVLTSFFAYKYFVFADGDASKPAGGSKR
jgi:putative flippase GtrA